MPNEQDIFLEAADLQKDEQAKFLSNACGDDAELKRSVEKLLATISDDGENILEKAAIPPAPTHTSPILPSRIGDYVVKEEIARGAMGVVYRAEQVSLGRTVALKMIRPSILTSETEIARFRAEAQTAAGIDDPNIIPVYEVGEVDGQHFFSMRLIEGGTLRDRIEEFTGHPKKAAQLVAKVARAVQSAHRHGILHRDLKPGNILIDEIGEPHVMDFGIARSLDSESDLTQTGQIVGTLNYMPPEQARSESHLTTAADVYGLGAILYQLITGKPPHQGESSLQILRAISDEEPERPTTIVLALDRDLETIALKCLEKNPEERYGTANELADELERWLAGKPIEARPVRSHERLAKWMRRKPVHAGFAATAVLFLLTLAIGGPLVVFKQARLQKETEKQLYFSEMNLASQALLGRSGFSSIRNRIDGVKPVGEGVPPWEWRFYDSLTRDKSVRFRSGIPEGLPGVCDWHPNGKILAVGGRSPFVRMFDPKGELLGELPVSNRRKDLGFNFDGSLLAVALDDRLVVFETASGKKSYHLAIDVGDYPCLAWHPTRRTRIALGGLNVGLQVWELDPGHQAPIFKITENRSGKQAAVGGLCWSPDGSKIGYGGGLGYVYVIDGETGERLHQPPRQRTMVNAVAWSKSEFGEFFSVDGNDARRVTLRVPKWRTVSTSENHTGPVNDLEFSPDGNHIASASSDSTVNVYQSIQRNEKDSLFGHSGPVNSLSWHPEGSHIASVSQDGWVIIHSLLAHREQPVWAAPVHADPQNFTIDPQGKEVAMPQAKLIRINHLEEPEKRFLEPDLGGRRILEVQWSPHRNEILAVVSDALFLIDSETGDIIESFENLKEAAQIQWSPNGSRLAFSPDKNKILIVARESQTVADKAWTTTGVVDHFRWSPDGSVIAATQGNNRPVVCFDVETGRTIREFEGAAPFRTIEWNPDGSQLVLGTNRSVSIFNFATGEKLRHFSGMENAIRSLHWSPDDTRLLIEIDRPFPPQIWDPVEGKKLIDLPLWNGQIRDIQWSPDGERVIILERHHLRVMTAGDGKSKQP